jgi:hypothetical protein
VILDNLNMHRARDVREWVAAHADAIELMFLPSYSPELNPYCASERRSQAIRGEARARPVPCRTSSHRNVAPARCNDAPIASRSAFNIPEDSTPRDVCKSVAQVIRFFVIVCR